MLSQNLEFMQKQYIGKKKENIFKSKTELT